MIHAGIKRYMTEDPPTVIHLNQIDSIQLHFGIISVSIEKKFGPLERFSLAHCLVDATLEEGGTHIKFSHLFKSYHT